MDTCGLSGCGYPRAERETRHGSTPRKELPEMPATTFVRAAIVSARPHVLLIHGAANSGAAWKFFQKALARTGWSNHAIDLRGHGESGGSVDGATMDDYVSDVARVADAAADQAGGDGVEHGWLGSAEVRGGRSGEGVRGPIPDASDQGAERECKHPREACTGPKFMVSRRWTQPSSRRCPTWMRRSGGWLWGRCHRSPARREMSGRRGWF